MLSQSSTEAKYRALALATAEVLWIRALLTGMQIKMAGTPITWCDNQGAIALATNPVYHAKTKHIEVDISFEKKFKLNKSQLALFLMRIKLLMC